MASKSAGTGTLVSTPVKVQHFWCDACGGFSDECQASYETRKNRCHCGHTICENSSECGRCQSQND